MEFSAVYVSRSRGGDVGDAYERLAMLYRGFEIITPEVRPSQTGPRAGRHVASCAGRDYTITLREDPQPDYGHVCIESKTVEMCYDWQNTRRIFHTWQRLCSQRHQVFHRLKHGDSVDRFM